MAELEKQHEHQSNEKQNLKTMKSKTFQVPKTNVSENLLTRLKQENEKLTNKYYFLKEKNELIEQNKELKNKIKQIRYKKINESIQIIKDWLKQ